MDKGEIRILCNFTLCYLPNFMEVMALYFQNMGISRFIEQRNLYQRWPPPDADSIFLDGSDYSMKMNFSEYYIGCLYFIMSSHDYFLGALFILPYFTPTETNL